MRSPGVKSCDGDNRSSVKCEFYPPLAPLQITNNINTDQHKQPWRQPSARRSSSCLACPQRRSSNCSASPHRKRSTHTRLRKMAINRRRAASSRREAILLCRSSRRYCADSWKVAFWLQTFPKMPASSTSRG